MLQSCKGEQMSSHSQHSLNLRNEAEASSPEIEALARELFERTSRDDTFDDLKRRAAFNRQDAGSLRHWIRVAQAKATERNPSASRQLNRLPFDTGLHAGFSV
jgi:hypothetical protein